MKSFFPDYAAFETYLDELGLFHMDLTLGRVENAIRTLGLAQTGYAAVQVVGTNGKGSTASYLAGLARARGLSVGLYTSPHFLSVRERVRVNGAMLSEQTWCDLANRVMDASGHDADRKLTYFEFLTVLGALAFGELGGGGGPVDLAVFEAGLGGTHDATTALHADLTLLTRIGLDHQSVLGRTIREIARDKAGAMRPGTPALSVDQEPEAMREIATVARERTATLARAEFNAVADALAPGSPAFPGGPHQSANARLAIAAFNELASVRHWHPYDEFDAEDILEILDQSRPRGRFQLVHGQNARPGENPLWVLDGAHNADALAATHRALAAANLVPRAIVFTCLADKDLDEIAPLVRALGDCPVHVPSFDAQGRERGAEQVARAIGPRAVAHESTGAAFARAEGEPGDGPVLICGSLYLLAQFYTLRPDCLD